MLFNSLDFAKFFAIVYSLYLLFQVLGSVRFAPALRFQNTLLLIAGYVFYGNWDVRFLYLIAFSTVVDFNIGLMLGQGFVPRAQRLISSCFLVAMAFLCLCVRWPAIDLSILPPGVRIEWKELQLDRGWVGMTTLAGTALLAVLANLAHAPITRLDEPSRKKLMLFVTVFVNLTFLGFFKYFNFFIDSAEAALRAMGYDHRMFHLNVALPVGISFYTFQSLSYTIDVSRGLVKPAQRFWDFALFVAFFPPMVAGPIERGAHLFPQLLKPRVLAPEQLQAGVWLITWGLFKKMVIADNLSLITSQIFGVSTYTQYGGVDLILGVLCFAFVIYCDFSGYTDIARGVGKLMGFELLINFRLPYFAVNPSDFWRRWHISLSSWLRDYLYIPLGGNRLGAVRTHVNLFITMLLGGLWHGASWNFVLWGAFHGTILILYRVFERHPDDRDPWGNRARIPIVLGKMVLMFCLTLFGWMLFACKSFEQIVYFCSGVFVRHSSEAASVDTGQIVSDLIFFVSPLLVMQLAQYLTRDLMVALRLPLIGRAGLIAAVIVATAIFGNRSSTEFIYFQF